MHAERHSLALALFGLLAALLMAAMVANQVHSGVSLIHFQDGRSVDTITRTLLNEPRAASGLRLSIGLNGTFIVAYTTFFTLLAARFQASIGTWAAGVGLGAFLVTAALDAVGTQHVLATLHAIDNRQVPSAGEMQAELVMMGLRFHGTYLGSALLALGFRSEGALGRAIAAILWFGYIPLGALIAVYPLQSAAPLWLARYVFFVLAFLGSALLFFRQSQRVGRAEAALAPGGAQ